MKLSRNQLEYFIIFRNFIAIESIVRLIEVSYFVESVYTSTKKEDITLQLTFHNIVEWLGTVNK